jgi:hypothetical protein
MKEYYATIRHQGHTKNEFLDDYDFDYVVDDVIEYFKGHQWGMEDFEEDDCDNALEVIEDTIRYLVEEQAVTDFGYKYGFDSYAYHSIAEAVMREVREKWDKFKIK